ncbi:MAG: YigZ family protein [Spirochaetales bacterium]|nr:YigZ family protein [Spirochaetales bacterium]MBQ7729240.1 YigZ family protein [Spirochaetales bacterium]
MKVLKEERSAELIVKKSRFIAIARTCSDPADVKRIVDQTRAQYPDATHVVHAAVMGSQFSYSDDHEPKNTAGRPALEVLKGSGITNIIVLIIRYFGGTLLGTGGLVKAYGDSTKMVLDGIATEELVEKARFSLTIGYEMYESVKRILGALKADSVTEDFATEISISGQIPISEKESLVSRISDLSNGRRTVLFN